VLHTARKDEPFPEAALFASTYCCDALAATAPRVRVYPKRELLAAFRSDVRLLIGETPTGLYRPKEPA
jgi:hypothetical protein